MNKNHLPCEPYPKERTIDCINPCTERSNCFALVCWTLPNPWALQILGHINWYPIQIPKEEYPWSDAKSTRLRHIKCDTTFDFVCYFAGNASHVVNLKATRLSAAEWVSVQCTWWSKANSFLIVQLCLSIEKYIRCINQCFWIFPMQPECHALCRCCFGNEGTHTASGYFAMFTEHNTWTHCSNRSERNCNSLYSYDAMFRMNGVNRKNPYDKYKMKQKIRTNESNDRIRSSINNDELTTIWIANPNM